MTNQAAQTMHPDALPDGTLSKSTVKRVEALAAASVSERARALMAQAYRDGGFPHAAGTLEAGVIDSVDSCALRALEQALTQRRDTTPQPSADAVREYVTELRAQADQKMEVAGACVHDCDRAHYKSAAQLLRRVADELESLLSAASGEKGVGG